MSKLDVDYIAAFATNLSLADIPEAVIDNAKVFIVDTVGVGLSGSRQADADRLLAAQANQGQNDAAMLFGRSTRTSIASAAELNAFQIHCQEFDCLHEDATVHAMAVVGGALFSRADAEGWDGARLLQACIVGLEVAISLGVAASTGLRFFRPANAGALGAVAGLANALDFTASQFQDAFGLMYSQLSGTMQAHVEGSVALPLQVGFAAQAANHAIDMALAGLSGPRNVLTGPFGYYRLFEAAGEPLPYVQALGTRWLSLELSHKPFPTGRAAHATLAAVENAMRSEGLSAENFAGLEARVPILIQRLVDRPYKRSMSVNYARLCLPYLVAEMLLQGRVVSGSFSNERLSDSRHAALANRIRIETDDNPDPNALSPQTIVINMSDGASITREVPDTLGSPANPLTTEQWQEKFRRCAADAELTEEQTARLMQQLLTIEKCACVSEIFNQTRGN